MSSLGIASTVFNLLSSIGGSSSAASSSSRSSISASATGGDFSSSLALQMAAMKAGPSRVSLNLRAGMAVVSAGCILSSSVGI